MSNKLKYPLAFAAANKIIKEFSLTHPDHIEIDSIAAELNVFIKEDEIKGSIARLVRRGKSAIITINSNIQELGQKRFAIAHELGHFLLHKKINQLLNCSEEMLLSWYHKRAEEPESNAFASELLMPDQIFRNYCKDCIPSFEEISNIADIFNTSLTSTTLKYIDYADHPCVLIVSKDGVVKWFYSNKEFPYRIISPGSKISKNSCAYDFFHEGLTYSEPETVIGSAWMENMQSGKNILLKEQIKALPKYSLVMSLIWPDEYK